MVMKEIILSGDFRCFLDDEDYERLKGVHWGGVNKRGKIYARNEINVGHRGDTKRTYRYMHREIIPVPPGCIIDHVNGNSLDNRRCNLRPCSRVENMANQKKRKDNTSGYKGVWKDGKRWRAEIWKAGQRYKLGSFSTLSEAVAVYDAKAKELNGAFAFLNHLL